MACFLNYNSQNNTAGKPILHYATQNTKNMSSDIYTILQYFSFV